MWHNAMLLAAALLLAACDSSAGTGDNPDPTMKTDASNPGKGDDPSQLDTTVPDSGGDTDNNTTADPDSANNVCQALFPLSGTWYCDPISDQVAGKQLDVLVNQVNGECTVEMESSIFRYSPTFNGDQLPMTTTTEDSADYHEMAQLSLSDDKLILEVYRNEETTPFLVLSFHR